MQRAELVDDEFQVGFDSDFEQRWHKAELAGRIVMILVTAAALLGLLGQGPFSHRTVGAPGDALSVDFEPVARHSTPTQVTVHMHPPADAATVDLLLDSHFIEPMGMLRTSPRAIHEATDGGGLRLTFAVPAGAKDQMVRIVTQPNQIGEIALSAAIAGGPAIHWSQFILP